MKKNKKPACLSVKRGFTLIELLIVIATIGILAGVILVSTNNARNRAANSATKQLLTSIKNNIINCCYIPGHDFGVDGGVQYPMNQRNELHSVGHQLVCETASRDFGYHIFTLKSPTVARLKNGVTEAVYTVLQGCEVDAPTVRVTLTGGNCEGSYIVSTGGIISPIPASCD
jgi:prepilin-type N-terminal cleavage/methylation domain-containing protein